MLNGSIRRRWGEMDINYKWYEVLKSLYVILWSVLGIVLAIKGKYLEGIACFILVNMLRR